jgi:hypothetical protein
VQALTDAITEPDPAAAERTVDATTMTVDIAAVEAEARPVR